MLTAVPCAQVKNAKRAKGAAEVLYTSYVPVAFGLSWVDAEGVTHLGRAVSATAEIIAPRDAPWLVIRASSRVRLQVVEGGRSVLIAHRPHAFVLCDAGSAHPLRVAPLRLCVLQ